MNVDAAIAKGQTADPVRRARQLRPLIEAAAAAYVDPAVAREIFGAPDAVLSWGPVGQNAKALVVDGGYRFSGSWPFASGSGPCALARRALPAGR